MRDALQHYPHLKEEMVRVVLVDLIPNVLPELGEDLGQYAGKKLTERKVELRMNTKIVGYSERGLEFDGGDFIRTVLVVWTAGVRAHPLVKDLPCKIEKGKAVVNEYLELLGAENVCALYATSLHLKRDWSWRGTVHGRSKSACQGASTP